MTAPHEGQDKLHPDDQRVLDALAASGFDADAIEAMPTADRERAGRLCRMFELLQDYPVEDGDDTLIYATLAGIDRHESERAARMAFDVHQEQASRGRRIRLPDFISVAAVMLIAAGVLWPTMGYLKRRALDSECGNNLRQVGYAFSRYAGDFEGAMPVAVAGTNVSWDTFANFFNLGPMLDGGYCDHAHLHCPGEQARAGLGYSYQCSPPDVRRIWGGSQEPTAAIGDRNPLIDAHRAGGSAPPLTISLSHGGRGQNVLASDGTVHWLPEPIFGKDDNIWLPDGESSLRRGAQPATAADAFLAH